jgi:superkiller protein 3
MALFDRLSSLLRPANHKKQSDCSNPKSIDEAQRLIGEGNDLEDSGCLEQALAIYDRACSLAPHLASAHLNRGNALLALGRAMDAVQVFRTAIAMQPGYAAAYFNLGNAEFECKNIAAALQSYDQAINHKSDFVDAWIAKANLFVDFGQLESAIGGVRISVCRAVK